MTSFRFMLLSLLVALNLFNIEALVSPALAVAPAVGRMSEPTFATQQVSAEQSKYSGYSYGESCLFGGSISYSKGMLWEGKQAAAAREAPFGGQENPAQPNPSFFPKNTN
eukprot:Nitzschia sp. Nitz4//scaffold21_size171442//16001//16330//NITZ4_002141-RA/size171442-processed-gene-0.39-mRNA-1//-1//CDS//3329542351//8108//frame0